MKILFIRPRPSPVTIGLQHLMVVEPLELEILAATVMKEHEVRIVDMILEKEDLGFFVKESDPDAVCLTGYITHIPLMIEYCRIVKRVNDNITTIVGGVHIECFPDDITDNAVDYRVIRNAAVIFPKLIEFLEGKSDLPPGVLNRNNQADQDTLPPYDFTVPLPARNLTRKYRKKYFYVFHNNVALIKTSFGCPFKCRFCFCRKIAGDNYFARPLADVISELEGIREKEIYIVDDDFLLSHSRVSEFIWLLKKHNIKKRYLVYGRADFISENPELMINFKSSGLRTVIVGLESFKDPELKEFHKLTTNETNKQAIRVLNQSGIDCYAAVIISPSWDKDDFKSAGKIMKELGIKFVNLQPLTPLKGTGLDIPDNKLLFPRTDYEKWDLAHVSIVPEKMSVKEFYENILDLYEMLVLDPLNLIRYIKYPLALQFKIIRGVRKVRKQYLDKIINAT